MSILRGIARGNGNIICSSSSSIVSSTDRLRLGIRIRIVCRLELLIIITIGRLMRIITISCTTTTTASHPPPTLRLPPRTLRRPSHPGSLDTRLARPEITKVAIPQI